MPAFASTLFYFQTNTRGSHIPVDELSVFKNLSSTAVHALRGKNDFLVKINFRCVLSSHQHRGNLQICVGYKSFPSSPFFHCFTALPEEQNDHKRGEKTTCFLLLPEVS